MTVNDLIKILNELPEHEREFPFFVADPNNDRVFVVDDADGASFPVSLDYFFASLEDEDAGRKSAGMYLLCRQIGELE